MIFVSVVVCLLVFWRRHLGVAISGILKFNIISGSHPGHAALVLVSGGHCRLSN